MQEVLSNMPLTRPRLVLSLGALLARDLTAKPTINQLANLGFRVWGLFFRILCTGNGGGNSFCWGGLLRVHCPQ